VPLGIFSMGLTIQISYPHRQKVGLIFLILNITSAIFNRLPQRRSYSLIKAYDEEKSSLRISHLEVHWIYTSDKCHILSYVNIFKKHVIMRNCQNSTLISIQSFFNRLYCLQIQVICGFIQND